MDISDRRSAVNHLARDFVLFFGHAPEHTGQQGSSESKTRANGEKGPAVKHEVSSELVMDGPL
jgi:hypothetical protein